MPSSTIPCYPLAPLAQLVEQLTLNQCEPSENVGKFALSETVAALGATVGAKNTIEAGITSGAVDARLRTIIDAWPTLSESDRGTVVATVHEMINQKVGN